MAFLLVRFHESTLLTSAPVSVCSWNNFEVAELTIEHAHEVYIAIYGSKCTHCSLSVTEIVCVCVCFHTHWSHERQGDDAFKLC